MLQLLNIQVAQVSKELDYALCCQILTLQLRQNRAHHTKLLRGHDHFFGCEVVMLTRVAFFILLKIECEKFFDLLRLQLMQLLNDLFERLAIHWSYRTLHL